MCTPLYLLKSPYTPILKNKQKPKSLYPPSKLESFQTPKRCTPHLPPFTRTINPWAESGLCKANIQNENHTPFSTRGTLRTPIMRSAFWKESQIVSVCCFGMWCVIVTSCSATAAATTLISDVAYQVTSGKVWCSIVAFRLQQLLSLALNLA